VVTKRTPKLAAGRVRITPRSIELFKVMRGLENCSCVWGPRYYNHRRCASCDRWWKLQCELHRELKLPPWCWPVMEHPPSAPPYDEIEGEKIHQRDMSHNGGPADNWDEDGETFERLKQAAGEV